MKDFRCVVAGLVILGNRFTPASALSQTLSLIPTHASSYIIGPHLPSRNILTPRGLAAGDVGSPGQFGRKFGYHYPDNGRRS
ncbi:hypothetical protein EV127DRAFT_160967 [Xylaria flabelliformis]|nr:hypothetical protein EV127DRAFT_160967 [Xylaria flabelliformis]